MIINIPDSGSSNKQETSLCKCLTSHKYETQTACNAVFKGNV